jgi:hypothetical protein
MHFDADAARRLSRRAHSVQDCLAVMKQCVMRAAQTGEFEVTVALSESLPVVAGTANNTAAFVVDFLARNGREAWSEASAQALRAGYTLRPAWGRNEIGPTLDGVTLAWREVESGDAEPAAGTPLLMRAAHAHALAQAEQAHVRWVEGRQDAIQSAARRGLSSASLRDALAASDPGWDRRREILHRAGFSTELIAEETGATLIVSW